MQPTFIYRNSISASLLGENDLDYIARDNAFGADALVVLLQQLKAPLVDAGNFLARPEKRHLCDFALQSRENHVTKRCLEKVAVERIPLLRVGTAKGRREFRLPAAEDGFAVRGIPVT